VVEELRQVLRHKGLKPPYVLVGHSLGGLYMQLFARAHPEEVKGLVLVDAMYPREVKATRDFPWAVRLAGRMLFSRTVWREIEKMDETGEAVLALPGIDDKPIVRLVNEPKPHPGRCRRSPSISACSGMTRRPTTWCRSSTRKPGPSSWTRTTRCPFSRPTPLSAPSMRCDGG
jgi:pimeloyl-ACP methyl ester carboxylesterase